MLQFQCPHCQTLIRVNDSAMGQRGTCPKCHQTLLIPMVTPAEQQDAVDKTSLHSAPGSYGASFTDEASHSGEIPGTEPAAQIPTEQQAVSDLFSAISSSEATSIEEDSIYRATVQSRRSNQTTVLTGLFFLLIAAGGAVAYYYFTQPLMQGEFVAQLMPANSIKPTLLTRKAIHQPELFEAFWLKHPDEEIKINSRLLEVSVLAQKRGLEFRLYPGSENDLYRVDLLKNQPLRDFYRKNSDRLEKVRKKILTESAGDFLKQMVNESKGLKRNTRLLIEFRDRMVLSSMVKGLGLRLTAIVDGKQYPCVCQDKDDKLYFSLPKGTVKFIIREKEFAGKKKVFPQSLRFTATCFDTKKNRPDNDQEPLISEQSKETESDPEPQTEPQTESEADSKMESEGEEDEKEEEPSKTDSQSDAEKTKSSVTA